MKEHVSILIVVVSDSVSGGQKLDTSGRYLKKLFLETRETFGQKSLKIKRVVVQDDVDRIKSILIESCDKQDCERFHLIFTVGGTGLGPRDVTPEATRLVIQREATCISNYMMVKNCVSQPLACLSRGTCGIRNRTLIINLPGSEKAVKESFEAILSVLPHALDIINGKTSHQATDRHATKKEFESMVEPEMPCQMIRTGCDSGNAIDFWESIKIINETKTKPPQQSVIIPVQESLGFMCCRNLYSTQTVPSSLTSYMDGYAVKAPLKAGTFLLITDRPSSTEDIENKCTKIGTGHSVPEVFNAVIPVENVRIDQTKDAPAITVLSDVEVHQYTRQIGSDLNLSDVVIGSGDRITFNHILLLSALGIKDIECYEEVRIGVLSTGDELLPLKVAKESKHSYDINSPLIEHEISIQKLGKVFNFGIVIDDLELLTRKLREMMTVCDIIITSGGSSVGEKDFINQALKKLQFDIKFGRIYIKPGKPTIFATASHDNKCIYFFGLPGNPVSCWVTYHLLVKTFLYKVLNISPPPIIKVKLSSDLETDEKRMEFLRARFLPRYDNGYRVVEVIPGGQHSSRFLSVCGCDLLVIIPSSYQKRCFPKGTLMEGIIISSI